MRTPFTQVVFEACPRLRVLSVWGTGLNHVDVEAAARHGIRVLNTAGLNSDAVAEHALALMLALARGLPDIAPAMRSGDWPRPVLRQLQSATLGVFGLGASGMRMVALGRALGMRVLGWSARQDIARARAAGCEPADKATILQQADFISLHLRLTPATLGFLSAADFAIMKPGAMLINTARGPLVDERALVEAVDSGRLAGAGLDVFAQEPLAPDHALRRLKGVVLTPHVAPNIPEVIAATARRAVDNIETGLREAGLLPGGAATRGPSTARTA